MTFLIVFTVIAVLIIFYLVGVYNKLVKKRTMMEEGWSGIDVQLKKRHNIIPNLVEIVKGYAKHEQETLQQVISARNSALDADGIKAQTNAENQLGSALANVFALSEAYPDLKANTNFLQLQNEIGNVEGDIEKARRYFNATVRENNILVESFPSVLIANAFKFDQGEYFELDEPAARNAPKIEF